MYHAYGNHKEN